ncbi:uncharacterized protein [Aristolochia californica]|uniref:uncharacterized protein n=1 Tax=Aristolochia californica TaxID=171875 RepID=UPI0035DBF481
MSEIGVSAESELRTIFINSSMKTHMVMSVSDVDTVGDFKRKVAIEHSRCFPDKGDIEIHAMKVKRKSMFYHLANSMLVRSAFSGFNGTWFLYMDATSTSLTRNLEASWEDHLNQSLDRPQSAELEPRNVGSSLDPAAAGDLLQPVDSSTINLGNSSFPDLPPLKQSVHNIQQLQSSNQFDSGKFEEPLKVLDHKSKSLGAGSCKSDDTGMQEPTAPSVNDVNNKDLGLDGHETRGELSVTLKKEKSKRNQNAQAGGGSAENLLLLSSKKKQKEMEIEVAYSDLPKDSVDEHDARDAEFHSNGELLKTLTDGEHEREVVASEELVSRHLSDDQPVEPDLIDGKKKKKKKHVKVQNEVSLLEAINPPNEARAEEMHSAPDKQNAVSGLELQVGPHEREVVASEELVSRHLSNDWAVEPDLIDGKKKKKKKHVKLQNEVSMLEAINHQNEAPAEEVHSAPDKQNAVSGLELQGGPHLYNDVSSSVANSAEVVQDVLLDKNKEAVIGGEVENKGCDALETTDIKSKKRKKHRSATDKKIALQLIEETNKEEMSYRNDKEILGTHEANDAGKENLISKDKRLDLNEAHMNGQHGNDVNDANVSIETIAKVLADLSAGQSEDADLGIESEKKAENLMETKEKKSKKSKKRRTIPEKHGAPQLAEEVNKENVGLKFTMSSVNISSHEGDDTVKEANASKAKVLNFNEAEMNNQDENDMGRSPKAHVVIQAGDSRDKRRTKVKAKKTRYAGVGKQDVSGEIEANEKSEDRVFDTDPHGDIDKEIDNGLALTENPKASQYDELKNRDAHKVSESEVKTTNLTSIIEDNLQSKDEKGRRKSKRSRASDDKALSQLSEKDLGIHLTDGDREESPSATNAKKSKSRKATLHTHVSETTLDKDKLLEMHGSAGKNMEEPKKRKKSRSEKAKLKTISLDPDLEKDMGIKADASKPGNDFIDFIGTFSAEEQMHESLEPREDIQAKGAHVEKEHQGKSDEQVKKLSDYSECTMPALESANKSNDLDEKRTSVITHENFGAASEAEQTALTENNTLLEKTNVDPTESSDNNTESVNGTIYTNGKGRRALSRSDRYRVAVRKPLNKKLEEVLNDYNQKKNSVANEESIFQQNGSESSEDGGEINYSDATTQNVSDDSDTSDFSGGGDETPRPANGENTKSPKNGLSKDIRNKETSGDEIVLSQSAATKKSLDTILRSSRRYKKAKVTASQILREDEESQQLELVPDSLLDHGSPVALSKP